MKPKPGPKEREGGDQIQSAFVCCWLIGLRPLLLRFGGLAGLAKPRPCRLLGRVALIGAPLTSPSPVVLIFFSGEYTAGVSCVVLCLTN